MSPQRTHPSPSRIFDSPRGEAVGATHDMVRKRHLLRLLELLTDTQKAGLTKPCAKRVFEMFGAFPCACQHRNPKLPHGPRPGAPSCFVGGSTEFPLVLLERSRPPLWRFRCLRRNINGLNTLFHGITMRCRRQVTSRPLLESRPLSLWMEVLEGPCRTGLVIVVWLTKWNKVFLREVISSGHSRIWHWSEFNRGVH